MKLALQPVRRNLRSKPAPPNLWTCAQRASIDSAISTFRTLSKICRAVTVSRSKFFRYRSSVAKRHASKPFRMNTCESVSKQRTLTTFRINTYEKPRGEGGPAFRVSSVQPQPPVSSLQNHMRHVAPLSPVASVDCAYFPSPRGCTTLFRPHSPLATRLSRALAKGRCPRADPVLDTIQSAPLSCSLTPAPQGGKSPMTTRRDFLAGAVSAAGAAMTPEPSHAHDHQHEHEHQAVPSDVALRVKALESLLTEKGLVDRAALDTLINSYEHKIGPRNGARVVARAWSDPAYKQRLLADANNAMAEFGYVSQQGDRMVVVENTPRVHNLIVCTLCSCYPWPVLGLPPVWYKSAPYRSRAVIDPRGVLREFGLELAEDVEVRVWDSTAEVRYLVLPEQPAGTERLSEEELATLVTRDAMVGVAKVVLPASEAKI